MPDKARLLAQIENAAHIITPFWPLKTFIAANPLAGFEHMDFAKAVEKGDELFGGKGLPSRAMGQKALAEGKINREILREVLQRHNAASIYSDMIAGKPDSSVKGKDAKEYNDSAINDCSLVNALMIKYLAAFLDEGQSGWEMPLREKGFYAAWKNLVAHDNQIDNRSRLLSFPDDAVVALMEMLSGIPDEQREDYLQKHLAALPGWSGFVKWRAKQKDYPWQQKYPITLGEMLAVRLAMCRMTGEDGLPEIAAACDQEGLYWLEAWEETYRRSLIDKLEKTWDAQNNVGRAEAQFVFCIDVRSEVFRRHLEACGNYETFGFAGFFGLPIRHKNFGEDISANSCPVLLSPQYETADEPCCGHEDAAHRHLHGKKTAKGFKALLLGLKNDIAAPFATVEASGSFFGLGMALRTFWPQHARSASESIESRLSPPVALQPTMAKSEEDMRGLSLSERIFHAEAALKIMGLTENFAPFIFLTGHGSETANNPYAAGLDCGACGGNHGGPNARLMADIFNDPQVREGLKVRGIQIPADSVFIGAQHNTTTDEVDILSPEAVPEKIYADLDRARIKANEERCATFSTTHKPHQRASDWAEVRPEWGLARNAAFIVGPRAMSANINLQGRSFLHSYDWEKDDDGKSLEIILTAPMVVAEWINTQYYFSTLDNAVYGSGSKVTHNVVGKIGVMQGNASDLMTGLPLQSVMSADGELYHEPLRLMTVVKAPLARVSRIIAENDILQKLFDNGWVALMVIDPHSGKFMRYGSGKIWHNIYEDKQQASDMPDLKKTKERELELEPA